MLNLVPEPPVNLIQAIRRCPAGVVLFLGAGFSQSVRRDDGRPFPSWAGFLHELLDWASNRGFNFPSNEQEAFRTLLSSSDPHAMLRAGEWLRSTIGETLFYRFCTESLNIPRELDAPLHELISRLPPLPIITLNYDRLLETVLRDRTVVTHADEAQLSDIQRRKEGAFILKAHGDLLRPETIILGLRDYRELMSRKSAYRAVLSTLFEQNVVLAIGCGLSDPDLTHMLDDIVATFEVAPLEVIALMPSNRIDPVTQTLWRRNWQVRLLEYTPSDDDHPEVREFLRKLVESASSGKQLSCLVHGDTAGASSQQRPQELTTILQAKATSFQDNFLQGMPSSVITAHRSLVADTIVRTSIAMFSNDISLSKEIEVIARGGYGRGSLSPTSDIDITVLTASASSSHDNELAAWVRFLMDTWSPMSVQVQPIFNTVSECKSHWREDLHSGREPSSLFSFASSRSVVGLAGLNVLLREEWIDFVTNDSFAPTIDALAWRGSCNREMTMTFPLNIKYCAGGFLDLIIGECLEEVVKLRDFRSLGACCKEQIAAAKEFFLSLREGAVSKRCSQVILQEDLPRIAAHFRKGCTTRELAEVLHDHRVRVHNHVAHIIDMAKAAFAR